VPQGADQRAVGIGRLSGVGALWDCVHRVCGGGGDCAGGDVPLGAVLALSWCGKVSHGGILIMIVGPTKRRPPAGRAQQGTHL